MTEKRRRRLAMLVPRPKIRVNVAKSARGRGLNLSAREKSDFRVSVGVIFANLGREAFTLPRIDRIGWAAGERGTDGLGSTVVGDR